MCRKDQQTYKPITILILEHWLPTTDGLIHLNDKNMDRFAKNLNARIILYVNTMDPNPLLPKKSTNPQRKLTSNVHQLVNMYYDLGNILM